MGWFAATAWSVVVTGGREGGAALVEGARVPVVSATGSTTMGRVVGQRVAARFGRSTLELGGNNATIVAGSADLDLALRTVAFGAIGTAGQRRTTLRRLFVQDGIHDPFLSRLRRVYGSVDKGFILKTSIESAGRPRSARGFRHLADTGLTASHHSRPQTGSRPPGSPVPRLPARVFRRVLWGRRSLHRHLLR